MLPPPFCFFFTLPFVFPCLHNPLLFLFSPSLFISFLIFFFLFLLSSLPLFSSSFYRMEYGRRAAVVASFRVGKKPTEVMVSFGFERTMVMDIWRKWKACENKDEFTAKRKARNVRSSAVRTDKFVAAVKETVGNDGSQSYAKIAADMGCHKSTICRTIKKDIGYSSYHKFHRMFITNASKESMKVKAVALLTELKHWSAGMLRFFSDEKNLIQDQTSNRQNDGWICKDNEEFPVLKHTKFPSSIMVLGVISSEGGRHASVLLSKGPASHR
ncbi:unnamed protein product [Acanthosepion pharaonis]|uniref:Transposase n=1 Tax=Acanthosepion pharaonis TaxID=158019 RepID=A0A812BUY9_ACAPH|nr:unnamed protein product [Sepia pharaonis]